MTTQQQQRVGQGVSLEALEAVAVVTHSRLVLNN